MRMIPPHSMQTTKKHFVESLRRRPFSGPPQGFKQLSPAGWRPADGSRGCGLNFASARRQPITIFPLLLVLLALIPGCEPPGARALLEGKKLLDAGEYARAIEEFRAATQLLPTNALAFNYLGLAFHQSGQVPEAERAYLRALALNHDLTEVHYDLGCLWLNQTNKLEQAKSEFTAYLLRQPNSADGWLRLGQAQLRSKELASADKSLTEALRLAPQNPETLTSLGSVRYQRKRPAEAVQLFGKALKEQPNYPPALLNLAIVAQQDLNDTPLALSKYREYLALKPVPEGVQAVRAVVRQLEQELASPVREPATNIAALTPPHSNTAKVVPTESIRPGSEPKPAVTNSIRESMLAKSEQATNTGKSVPTNVLKQTAVTNAPSTENYQVVKLAAEPVIKPAEDIGIAQRGVQPQTTDPLADPSSPTAASNEAHTQKRGFFQKINPINLFAHDSKPSSGFSPPPSGPTDATAGQTNTTTRVPAETRSFPRYTYRSPEQPVSGDRRSAEQAFTQGVQAQQARHLPEAIQSYRRAAQLDPAYFDAHYNLGLAASESSNLPMALAAYEAALAIQPESLDARYNFGLVLKQAGYFLDSVSEFERILSKYPNDGRAHLALGNLYAQQLQEPAKARQHYLAVLAIAPQSPQAGAIRYWLSDHPK
jgi:tetratricopeptide (TPR) repeat protein